MDLSFYNGKTVLITGHTGFKGAWLAKILAQSGARVVGYALTPPTEPNLFDMSGLAGQITSVIGDIRDYAKLHETFEKYKPEIVFHLCAQAIVLNSYMAPRETYEINTMGTVNLLECVRSVGGVRSLLIVTTDKVYAELAEDRPFVENDRLNGYDPYSNSKSCAELIVSCYKRSFLSDLGVAVSTMRAGNCIGGGDFGAYRLVPDMVRALMSNAPLLVRNPNSVRPWESVFDALSAYLLVAEKQYKNINFAGEYNVGPSEQNLVSTIELVQALNDNFKKFGAGVQIQTCKVQAGKEMGKLTISQNKIKNVFGFTGKWDISQTLAQTAEFTRIMLADKKQVPAEMERQIKLYLGDK